MSLEASEDVPLSTQEATEEHNPGANQNTSSTMSKKNRDSAEHKLFITQNTSEVEGHGFETHCRLSPRVLDDKEDASDVNDKLASWRIVSSPSTSSIPREARHHNTQYFRRKLALRAFAMLLLVGCIFGALYLVVGVDWHGTYVRGADLVRVDTLPYQPILAEGQRVRERPGSGSGSGSHRLGIMHGADADPGQFPWLVDLQEVDTGLSKCGGSLIATGWVLTAAHCVVTLQPADIRVVMGEHDIEKSDKFEQISSARRFVIQPDFSMRSALPNDIALIELETPAVLNERVALISISKNDSKFTDCSVAGWGAAGVDPTTGMPIYPSVLQHVNMARLPLSECKERLIGYRLTSNMTCAEGSEGAAVCWGDSGGSLSCRRAGTDAPWTLVGITSWGVACGYLDFPSVYTKVNEFTEWLEAVTGVVVT